MSLMNIVIFKKEIKKIFYSSNQENFLQLLLGPQELVEYQMLGLLFS